MRIFLLILILTCSLFANKLNIDDKGNILLTPQEYVTVMAIQNKTSHNVIEKNKPTEYFTLTSDNIGTVIEILLTMMFVVGTVMFYRFKLITIEENYKSIKETVGDHEQRIKVNEDNQSHYATKEAVMKDIKMQNTSLEALSALNEALKNGEN